MPTDATNVSITQLPLWAQQYGQTIASLGGQLAQMPYVPYGGPRIADYTPMQYGAMNLANQGAGIWQPGMQMGQNITAMGAGMAAGAGQFNPNTYENTYWQTYAPGFYALNQQIADIGQRDFTNTTLANLNANFGGSGGWGGGRHQILGQDAAAAAQGRISEAQINAYNQQRQMAMQDYLNWSKQGMQGGQTLGQLGGQLGTLGGQQQDALWQDVQGLGGLGAMQQQMAQKNLDLSYQDFMQQQQYPWQQLQNWGNLVKGVPVQNQSVQMSQGAGAMTNPWTAGINGLYSGYNNLGTLLGI